MLEVSEKLPQGLSNKTGLVRRKLAEFTRECYLGPIQGISKCGQQARASPGKILG